MDCIPIVRVWRCWQSRSSRQWQRNKLFVADSMAVAKNIRSHPFTKMCKIGCGLTSRIDKRKALDSLRESRALELLARFELATSSLPRMRSTGWAIAAFRTALTLYNRGEEMSSLFWKNPKDFVGEKNVPGIVDQTIPGCSREKRGKKNEKRMLALLLTTSLYRGDIKKLSQQLLNMCEVERNSLFFYPLRERFIAMGLAF